MKRLETAAIILSAIAVFIFILVHVFTGAATTPYTNEIAIDQLNGGNSAYVTLQAWHAIRNIAIYTGYAVASAAIILIAIIIVKVLKERNK